MHGLLVSHFFLNIMLTVLLGEKFRLLSAAHASNLLVTLCNALDAILWLLVVMYIARLSAKSDPSTLFPSFPNIDLIATKYPSLWNFQVCLLVLWNGFSYSHLNLSFTNQFSDELHHSSLYFYVFYCSSVFPLLTLS